jgi:hypothetical protein
MTGATAIPHQLGVGLGEAGIAAAGAVMCAQVDARAVVPGGRERTTAAGAAIRASVPPGLAVSVRSSVRVSAIQRCFLSEEFISRMEAEPVDLDQIFADLGTAEFGTAAVDVQGTVVPCCRVVYRGVEFAGALDQVSRPFTIARRVAGLGAWPALAVATNC